MSTLISADELGLRRPDPAPVRQLRRKTLPASQAAALPLLERLAAWFERQPTHRRVGSHTLIGLAHH